MSEPLERIEPPPTDFEVEPVEELLYHYTSISAFINILHTRVLRATHVRYMNDQTEQKLISELLSRRIQLKKSIVPPEEGKFLNEVLLHCGHSLALSRTFVACFSVDGGDRLSQWRGYASRGEGISIGFSRAALKHFHPGEIDCNLVEIRYLDPDCDSDPNDLVDHLLQDVTNRHQIYNVNQMAGLSAVDELAAHNKQINNAVDAIGAMAKHIGFVEEQEARLLCFPYKDSPIDYRSNGSAMIPFIELPIFSYYPECIREVVIGPSPHMELSLNSMHGCLRKNGMEHVSVRLSRIPYRQW